MRRATRLSVSSASASEESDPRHWKYFNSLSRTDSYFSPARSRSLSSLARKLSNASFVKTHSFLVGVVGNSTCCECSARDQAVPPEGLEAPSLDARSGAILSVFQWKGKRTEGLKNIYRHSPCNVKAAQ